MRKPKRRFMSVLVTLAVLLGVLASTANLEHLVQAQDPYPGIARITVDELKALLEKRTPVTVLDVRSGMVNDEELRIKGAVRIPPEEIERRLSELPRNREVVTYCA